MIHQLHKQTQSYRFQSTNPHALQPLADTLTTEFVQGPYGCQPWGLGAKFYDPTASWIWNSPNANINALFGVVVPFGATYVNPASHSVNGTVNIIVDNMCDVFLNGVLAFSVADGSYKGGYPAVKVLLAPGLNTFIFKAVNMPNMALIGFNNPAGLIYAVVGDGGDILIHSGGNVREFTG